MKTIGKNFIERIFFLAVTCLAFYNLVHGNYEIMVWQVLLLMALLKINELRYFADTALDLSGEALEKIDDTIKMLKNLIVDKKTYMIIGTGDSRSITCLRCMKTSWSKGDVENLWCENCKEFHIRVTE